MKKIYVLLFIVLLLTACNKNTNENILYTEGIMYDVYGLDRFGFDVSLVVSDKNANIEFEKFYGENVDDITVKLNDDTFDNIKDICVNGQYIKLIGFACEIKTDVVITGVSLLINGKEEKYDFSHPISHKITDMEFTGDIQVNNYPMIIMTNSYSNTEYQFVYSAEVSATINNIYINDFVKFDNLDVYINDKRVGTYKECLPITVKAGDTIKFTGNFGKKDEESFSDYASVYFDVIMEYSTEGQNHSVRSGIVSQGVSNEEDATNLLKLLVGKGE